MDATKCNHCGVRLKLNYSMVKAGEESVFYCDICTDLLLDNLRTFKRDEEGTKRDDLDLISSFLNSLVNITLISALREDIKPDKAGNDINNEVVSTAQAIYGFFKK